MASITFTKSLLLADRFDPYKHTNKDMAKAHMVTYETLLEDEECQVMGFTHVGDLRGVSAAHVTLWPPREFTTLIRWGEVCPGVGYPDLAITHVVVSVVVPCETDGDLVGDGKTYR